MPIVRTAELGTVEYTISKIVKVDDKATWYKFGDRKMLFRIRARMKAGVVIENESCYNAQIDEEKSSIVLTLPHAKVLSFDFSPLDAELMYEQVSLTRFDFSNEERNAVLRHAQCDILSDKSEDIVNDAEANARLYFETMLKEIGFSHVTVIFTNN